MAEMLPKADFWAIDRSMIKTAFFIVFGMLAITVADAATGIDLAIAAGFINGAGLIYVIVLVALQEAFFKCKNCKHLISKHESRNGVPFAACKGKKCTCVEYVQTVRPLTKAGEKALGVEKP